MLALVVVHVFANTVWVGSIATVGWLLVIAQARATDFETASSAARFALRIYRTLATPAFLVSFCAAILRVLEDPNGYLHAHWFHGKLAAALGFIVIHHILGARARRLVVGRQGGPGAFLGEASRRQGASRVTAALVVIALAFALLAVTFAVGKAALVP